MLMSGKGIFALRGDCLSHWRTGGKLVKVGRGFTLIEMMIAVVILGLMLALALPNFTTWMQNARIRSATESFLNGLQLARNEAVRRNSDVQFVVGVGSAWVVSCRVVTPGCDAAAVAAIQRRTVKEGSSADITVAASDGATIRFDSFGRMSFPVPAGANVTFNFDNSKLSAAISRDLRVTIETTGDVRMCDPNVVAPDVRRC